MTQLPNANELIVGQALRELAELHEGRMFRLDTFSGETLLMHPIPRPGVDPPAGAWVPRPVTDIDITHLIEFFQAGRMKKVARGTVDHSVDAEGHRNAFSSVQDAFRALPPWDGTPRIDNFWRDYCGAKDFEDGMSDDEVLARVKYLQATGRCFFISICARAMRPGCKLDTMVVLEGPQGTKKSTLLRVLALRDTWFSDSMPDNLADKDARQHLPGKLVIEMAEIGAIRASRVEAVKKFVSAQDDKYRPSYGKRDKHIDRQGVFVGTTNATEWLVDITGNRRFWPIQTSMIDIDKVRADLPQLYAEALAALDSGEDWYLSEDVEMVATAERQERLETDPWVVPAKVEMDRMRREAIARGSSLYWVSSQQVLDSIESKHELHDAGKLYRCARVLAKLGGVNMKLPRGAGWPARAYRFEIR